MTNANNPLSAEKLTNIFRTSPKDPFRIINRESSTIEFKESYNHAGMSQYLKTMAAFANNSGGYIIFGIGENPRRLVGLKEKNLKQFEEIKVEEFTKNLLEFFSPEIKWDHVTFEFRGMSFGVIYTFELASKPCICKKNYEDKNPKYSLKESDIYYRYGGRSERIKYSELTSIIENERKNEEKQWIKFLREAAKVGIENVGLLDLNSGIVSGKGGAIVIDESIIDKISFIKEGEFVEKEGKPTLRIIGDVQKMNSGKVVIEKQTQKIVKAIELSEIMDAFFESREVNDPLEYVRVICSFATSANYPIYCFIKQADASIEDAIEAVEKTTRRGNVKEGLLQRLRGKRIPRVMISNAYTIASEAKRMYLNQWLNNNITFEPEKIKYCVQSLLSLTDEEIQQNEEYIKTNLKIIYESYFEKADQTLASEIRKAICRIDEALYYTD